MAASPSPFSLADQTLIRRHQRETLTVTGGGRNSVRVRATRNVRFAELPSALIGDATEALISLEENSATLESGELRVQIDAKGLLTFSVAGTERSLLIEAPAGRAYRSIGGGLDRVQQSFLPDVDERFYGLGQHQHGRLEQKGCVIDLEQRNTEVAIPFLLSSRGYGFLWNNPAVGRVELAQNGTRWIAEATPQIDYWVTLGNSPAEILENYADATGHAPAFPEWAAGFWQSKLRYRTQAELLTVAHEHRLRGLPLSVIVIDYFHWPAMGEWRFDPVAWPDPAAMVRELAAMGVKVMVSVWPTVNAACADFPQMLERGLLVGTERGVAAVTSFVDTPSDDKVYIHQYDATNPEAREFLWAKVRENYVAYGIKIFWLDACEPELNPFDHENLRYHAGNGAAVGCAYPLAHQQAFYEGLRSMGEREILTLSRSAWAGSQRYGAALWSGDIASTFEALQIQVRAGLNAGLSGIPWWTTDIGGFHGADIESDYFRELIVRWFQYGVFCPLFRLHGVREPATYKSGGPNEVWEFGDRAYAIISRLMHLRERLRPYILRQMQAASEHGLPPMRPLFFDFPDDPDCTPIDDQFFFGPDILVAPVLHEGASKRDVYLPAGAEWLDAWTGEPLAGGKHHTVDAPLESVPVFLRDAQLLKVFREP